jgi:hypothetical protein
MTRTASGLARALLLSLCLCACGDTGEPGGGLGSEVVRTADVDWSFAHDLPLAVLQSSSPPRARAVWLLIHEGELYIPTGIARRASWPRQLEGDPLVLLRVLDRLYLRHASRVTDSAELATLREATREKYGAAPRSDDPSSGFFRMDPAPDRG